MVVNKKEIAMNYNKETQDALYEALKQIQKWLLEGVKIEEGEAKLLNTQFVKANNLAAEALSKAE